MTLFGRFRKSLSRRKRRRPGIECTCNEGCEKPGGGFYAYQQPPIYHRLSPRPIPPPPRKLMQRLSNWFEDHLPRRRRSQSRRADLKNSNARGGTQKAAHKSSRSAAPASSSNRQQQQQLNRYPLCSGRTQYYEEPAVYTRNQYDLDEDDRDYLKLMERSACVASAARPNTFGRNERMRNGCYALPLGLGEGANTQREPPNALLSQSFTGSSSSGYSSCRRQRIRTNPWIPTVISPQRVDSLHVNSNATLHLNPPNTMMLKQGQTPNWRLYASINRSGSLNTQRGLDESISSSGYGSQDSSPESSVHSPDWQQQPSQQLEKHGMLEDKAIECRSIDVDEASGDMGEYHNAYLRRVFSPAKNAKSKKEEGDDENIYYELECLNRLSVLLDDEQSSINSELALASSRYASPQLPPRFCSSPIYAVPYESSQQSNARTKEETSGYRKLNRCCPNGQKALAIASPFFPQQQLPKRRQSTKDCYFDFSEDSDDSENYIDDDESNTTSCSSWTPMVTQRIGQETAVIARPDTLCSSIFNERKPAGGTMKGKPDEFDFLAELDQQIAELQIQSDAVRDLVEQAKGRHELRQRTRQLCMEHLQELRKMRWFMHHNFELCL